MWPFGKKSAQDTLETPESTLKASTADGRMRELELRIVDLEDSLEKVLEQLKRMNGRITKRLQREVEPPAPEPAPEPANGQQLDHKAALRTRAFELQRGAHR